MAKSRAVLEAEIREILRRPILRGGPKDPSEPLREYVQRVSTQSKLRQKRLHQALIHYPAIVVTDSRGRQTLLISSGEMSNPEDGAYRVTKLLKDGPEGHVTRRSILRLAQDLSRDLSPDRIEPVTEDQVMAWVSTPEYVEGSERVMEMQRRNRR